MYYRLLDLLCCPFDGGFPLKLISHQEADRPAGKVAEAICCEAHCGYRGRALTAASPAVAACEGCLGIDIEEGELTCPSCARRFPISAGIPQLLPDELAVTQEEPPTQEANRIKWLQQRQRDREAEIFEADFLPFSTRIDTHMALSSLDPKPQDRVLDAGSGPGRLTRCLVSRSREIVALDFSHRCLALLAKDMENQRDASVVHCVLGDVEHKPLRDGLFDKVLSFGILEHLPDHDTIKNTLSETHRVMAPGGVVMFTAYSQTPVRVFMARILGIDYDRDGWHNEIFFHRAKLDEMRSLIEAFFPLYEISGIRNFPRHLGQKLQPLSTAIDLGLSATSLSRFTGYYFLVRAIAGPAPDRPNP
jgi:uncharacterized protein YbaR (Trm112 family)/ubiquinone/menaquinone biosynthesis C-methylase UbiE